jgi:MoxR-like ATPase
VAKVNLAVAREGVNRKQNALSARGKRIAACNAPETGRRLLRSPRESLHNRNMSSSTQDLLERLQGNIARVLRGKPEAIRLAVVALLADGHLLIEDVPGVGKTLLARALARTIGGTFRRIQFTPDLLPSDITGTNVFNTQTGSFTFKQGPIFANVVLADEINRTTPRTQSALLEAMNDRQVSADGETYPLEPPFMVLATQNPFEFEGTYALPESQLDRFMLRIRIGYPRRSDELQLLADHRRGEPIDELEQALSPTEVLALQAAVRDVRMDDALSGYLMDLIDATRRSPDLHVGASPRGALFLYRAAQALAVVEKRDYVVPDDIKRLAVPVLSHRVIGKSFLQDGESGQSDHVIRAIVEQVTVPD